jgi:hypothetical protein
MTSPSILNITNVTVTVQMFLSRSRSLKIKKKLFDKMKHASRTFYNNLVSRSVPYWSLNFTDCAMENTLSFSNTSAKMNFASSDCSATISISNSLSWLYFLHCCSKKMVSKEESVNHFIELLTYINEMGIIHTNLSASSDLSSM